MTQTEKTQNTTTNYGEKFHKHVTDNILAKDLARLIREYNYLVADLFLNEKEPYISAVIPKTRHHLNVIAEILDPYFSREEANNG